ncbi:MAG TPA: FKBP-type peptidyl-prolyl cis-trans isomerase [Fibrella sp.]
MTKYSIALLALLLSANSCKQTDPTPTTSVGCNLPVVSTKAPQAEVTALKQYLDANGIMATADERGFFYTIQAAGSGAKPTICSNVTVNYTGKLTTGSTFDSANGISFDLNRLIVGWQEGIPLIAPGGSITLYLPPTLAYGSRAQTGIPANSNLIFTIDLLRVN